jgi:hypothetical protein
MVINSLSLILKQILKYFHRLEVMSEDVWKYEKEKNE